MVTSNRKSHDGFGRRAGVLIGLLILVTLSSCITTKDLFGGMEEGPAYVPFTVYQVWDGVEYGPLMVSADSDLKAKKSDISEFPTASPDWVAVIEEAMAKEPTWFEGAASVTEVSRQSGLEYPAGRFWQHSLAPSADLCLVRQERVFGQRILLRSWNSDNGTKPARAGLCFLRARQSLIERLECGFWHKIFIIWMRPILILT